MAFSGIIPTILLGLVFVALGFLVWKKKWWAALLPWFLGLGFIVYAFVILNNAKEGKQAMADYSQLIRELNRDDFRSYYLSHPDDEQIQLLSLASQALYTTALRFPAQKQRVLPLLREYADFMADSRRFPTWGRTNKWKESVFFLAHAGIIIGHYQNLSKDETHAQRLRQVGEYLGGAIPVARYKNLISRSSEDMYRPADNAAALYAVHLYDLYYATEYSESAQRNWLNYLESELKYAESHLPCSAFSSTNTCKLDPTAAGLGMMVGYLGASGATNHRLYREWQHYFKRSNWLPLRLTISSKMRGKSPARFCDQGSAPLSCEDQLIAIGMWLAATYQQNYVFARGLSGRMIARDQYRFQLGDTRPVRRVATLMELAIYVMAEMGIKETSK
ncbi:MAG: hypothetical protein AAFU67_08575 [Bacteroidota bacterium]